MISLNCGATTPDPSVMGPIFPHSNARRLSVPATVWKHHWCPPNFLFW